MTGRPSPFRFLRNLRARIIVVALVALVPGFVVAFFAAENERSSARRRAELQTATAVATTSDRYQMIVDNSDTLLHTLAEVPAIAGGTPACAPLLRLVIGQAKQLYDNIVVFDGTGRVKCSAEPVGAGPSFADRAWFAETIRTRKFAVGGFERDGSEPSHVSTAIAVPAQEDPVRAVVVGQISLRALADRLAPTNLPSGSALTLTDADDRILFRFPDSERWTGQRVNEAQVVHGLAQTSTPSPAVVAKGADGVKRVYTASVLVPPVEAIVYAGIPTEVAYAEATSQFRIRMAALIVAAALALALASIIAELAIGRRVRTLVGLARRVGSGDLAVRSRMEPTDEVGELGHALDAMTAELHARDLERDRLLTAVVQATEDERRRIAGDVHDDSIQVMSAHVMGLQLLRRHTHDEQLAQRISELEESGRAAIARLRDLVFDLHSPVLEERGLGFALEVLCHRTFEGEAVAWEVTDLLEDPPRIATRDTAYRIAQEAIVNARRHANATRVSVDLAREHGDLVVQVADDGDGFGGSVTPRPGHLGLHAARERASAIGGTLVVRSSPGRGTVVVCRLPWPSADDKPSTNGDASSAGTPTEARARESDG